MLRNYQRPCSCSGLEWNHAVQPSAVTVVTATASTRPPVHRFFTNPPRSPYSWKRYNISPIGSTTSIRYSRFSGRDVGVWHINFRTFLTRASHHCRTALPFIPSWRCRGKFKFAQLRCSLFGLLQRTRSDGDRIKALEMGRACSTGRDGEAT
jgi:hypothetical protein